MLIEFEKYLEKMLAAFNLQVTRVTPPFNGLENFDYGLRKALDSQFDWPAFGRLLLDETPANTLVFAQGVFELHFAIFKLPDQKDTVILVGPWSDGHRSDRAIEWCRTNLDDAANKTVEEYYNAVRVISSSQLRASLYAVVSMLYPEGLFSSAEWHEFMPLRFRPNLHFFTSPAFQHDLPASLIAQRYTAENALLDAVKQGDTDAALVSLEQFRRFRLSPRSQNPLRDTKNLLVIFNTLLRKTIEQAGVHPYYIDEISAKYALSIETVISEEENNRLFDSMVREYCLYVQLYSLREYSPLIQKVINYINLNLTSALSLKHLAEVYYISPSYLSNLFKQETGQTLTDYINNRRIQRAARRLVTTEASIAAIAESVGILDVNYFTKMFKRVMGMTPTRYRRESKAQQE